MVTASTGQVSFLTPLWSPPAGLRASSCTRPWPQAVVSGKGTETGQAPEGSWAPTKGSLAAHHSPREARPWCAEALLPEPTDR